MLKHPMKKPGIAINSARCMACYACFMACKDEHCGWDTDLSKSQPEMGQYWMNIKEWERGDNERHNIPIIKAIFGRLASRNRHRMFRSSTLSHCYATRRLARLAYLLS